MLKKLEINNTCSSCDACRSICPEDAILTNGENYEIDTWSCSLCMLCVEICPENSIKLIPSEAKLISNITKKNPS